MRKIVGVILLLAVWSAQAAIIGVDIVDIEVRIGSPTNWNSYTALDVNTAKTNLIDENGLATNVAFRIDGSAFDPGFFTFDAGSPSYIPSHTTDLTAVCCDVILGGQNPTIATWSGLTAFGIYDYWVFTSASSDDKITVTGDTVDSFGSPAINPENQRINGILGNSSLSFVSYARQITASADGTIQIAIESRSSPTPSGYAIASTVPVPAAVWLFGSGLGLLGWMRRRAQP